MQAPLLFFIKKEEIACSPSVPTGRRTSPASNACTTARAASSSATPGSRTPSCPLRIAAEREDLFAYPGLFVAELGGEIAGFAACTQEELAWLYVDPAHFRKGVGRALAEHALQRFPGIRRVEVLSGNAPAKALYARLGFVTAATERGRMPGNEAFSVQVDCMERR